MHICVSDLTIIGSDNGLPPARRQAIIWTNAGILLIGPSGTNFSENLIEILIFSFKKMCLKVSSVKWRPFCLGLNVLILGCPNQGSYLSWAVLHAPEMLAGEEAVTHHDICHGIQIQTQVVILKYVYTGRDKQRDWCATCCSATCCAAIAFTW